MSTGPAQQRRAVFRPSLKCRGDPLNTNLCIHANRFRLWQSAKQRGSVGWPGRLPVIILSTYTSHRSPASIERRCPEQLSRRTNFLEDAMSSRKALSISVFLAASVSPFHTMAQEGAAAAPVRVRAVEVARQRVTQTVHVTGEIRARFQTDLSFRVAGRIVERSVDVGDTVRTGDVLARLDADEQAADTAVARADLESAKAAFNQARLEYRRRENLLQTQVITRAAMEEAQKVLDSASENVIAAEARLASAVDANSYTYLRANSPGVVTAKMA